MTDDSHRDQRDYRDHRIERDELAGESATTYERASREQPSEAVVRAVASFTGTPVLDLEPLYEAVDPEHLDALFDDSGTGRGARERTITFEYEGCTVAVDRDVVRVERPDAGN